MRRIFFPVVILSIALWGTLTAQEINGVQERTTPAGFNSIIDADNPGMESLDLATEAKLRATTIMDLSNVIALCQRAIREGLTSENLRFCNQLLASAQLQRGLFLAQQLLSPPNVRPGDWQAIRQMALSDLEEAVTIIKDQPMAYLRMAQLNLLPNGDIDRAREALTQAIQSAGNDPTLQMLAARLLVEIEPEAEAREAVLSAVAQNGNPQIVLLHALTLLELGRNDDAANVLRQLIEAENDDIEMHDNIVTILTEVGEHELALSVLDAMREKAGDDRRNRIDLMRADILNSMARHEDALALLNSLGETVREDVETTVMILILRSNTHLALDNLDEALKDVETAEQLRPDFLPALEQKYRILLEQENYNDALEIARRLQTLDERQRPQDFLREIHALTELERYDEAIEVVQTLQEKFPDGEQQWLAFLVEIYSKQGTYDKALALVKEQLKEHPDDLRWILAKAGIYSEQKMWEEAINWLESQLEREPDSRTLNIALIGVLADRNSLRAARERIRPLLEKEPDNLMLLRWDSQLSISSGHHHDAIEALEKVVEADSSDYTSINNLAWVLATSPIDSLRDGRRAVELAEKAGELTRHKRAFALSTLAAAYAEVGDFERAREWWALSVEVAKTERGKTEEARQELLEHLEREWEAFSQDQPFREMLDKEGE